MKENEREDRGMDKDGNILFRIRFKTERCKNIEVNEDLFIPSTSKDYEKISPKDGYFDIRGSGYELADITEICIEFKDYKYDGRNKKFCEKTQPETTEIPPDFVSMPTGTRGGGMIQRGGKLSSFTNAGEQTTNKCPAFAPLDMC